MAATSRSLDDQLATLQDQVLRAGHSLLTLYLASGGFFRRDSLVDISGIQASATSTSRAYVAMVEYLRFLSERTDVRRDDEGRAVIHTIQEVTRRYLMEFTRRPDWVRTSPTNGINAFSDGHLLLCYSLLPSVQHECGITLEPDEVESLLTAVNTQIAEPRLNELQDQLGGRLASGEPIHDFVTFYLLRGLDAFNARVGTGPIEIPDDLQQRISESTRKQLGNHKAGLMHQFDSGELVFTASLLQRAAAPDADQLQVAAIEVIVAEQTADGAWPGLQIVSYRRDRSLYLTSYEVALTLATMLDDRLERIVQSGVQASVADSRLIECILSALDRSLHLVDSTYTRVGRLRGWCNDRARRGDLIEAWTTAIVMSMLVKTHRALSRLRQHDILQKYQTEYLRRRHLFVWADLDTDMQLTDAVDDEALLAVPEPFNEQHFVFAGLRERLIVPLSQNWVNRPAAGSLILYGPPGTRKTSLVRALARCLGWPLLVLSPPDFLIEGLEGFERVAAELFRDLMKLQRVVILFDECEDFFKKRPTGDDAELSSRTAGAFITSGMLPRLQNLRDRRWVIFVVATNSELSQLDSAVIRPGRFDYALRLPYPTTSAAHRYLREKLSDLQRTPLQAVLDGVSDFDGELRYPALDELIRELKEAGLQPRRTEVAGLLERISKREGPTPLRPGLEANTGSA